MKHTLQLLTASLFLLAGCSSTTSNDRVSLSSGSDQSAYYVFRPEQTAQREQNMDYVIDHLIKCEPSQLPGRIDVKDNQVLVRSAITEIGENGFSAADGFLRCIPYTKDTSWKFYQAGEPIYLYGQFFDKQFCFRDCYNESSINDLVKSQSWPIYTIGLKDPAVDEQKSTSLDGLSWVENQSVATFLNNHEDETIWLKGLVDDIRYMKGYFTLGFGSLSGYDEPVKIVCDGQAKVIEEKTELDGGTLRGRAFDVNEEETLEPLSLLRKLNIGERITISGKVTGPDEILLTGFSLGD